MLETERGGKGDFKIRFSEDLSDHKKREGRLAAASNLELNFFFRQRLHLQAADVKQEITHKYQVSSTHENVLGKRSAFLKKSQF